MRQGVQGLMVPAAAPASPLRHPSGAGVPVGRLRPVLHHLLQSAEPHQLLPRGAAALHLHTHGVWEGLCHEAKPAAPQHHPRPRAEEAGQAPA